MLQTIQNYRALSQRLCHIPVHICHAVISAPRITGGCSSQSSSSTSLTYTWNSAKSATSYRLVGHGVANTSSTNTITVDFRTPGTLYTFTVWAIGFQGLTSNNITCVNSTGTLSYKLQGGRKIWHNFCTSYNFIKYWPYFQFFFTVTIKRKFVIMLSLKFPSHFKGVAILPFWKYHCLQSNTWKQDDFFLYQHILRGRRPAARRTHWTCDVKTAGCDTYIRY